MEGLEPNETQMDALVSLKDNLKLSTSHLIALAGVEKPKFSSLTHDEARKVISFAMQRRSNKHGSRI